MDPKTLGPRIFFLQFFHNVLILFLAASPGQLFTDLLKSETQVHFEVKTPKPIRIISLKYLQSQHIYLKSVCALCHEGYLASVLTNFGCSFFALCSLVSSISCCCISKAVTLRSPSSCLFSLAFTQWASFEFGGLSMTFTRIHCSLRVLK